MERKGDDVLSNPSDAPKNDQTPTPTLDQDQEGDGEGKTAEADDDDVTVEILLNEIQFLRTEERELMLKLNAVCKKLHRSEAALWATCQELEEEVKIRKAREEELQQVVEALEEIKTRLEMELAGFRSQIDGHLEIQGEPDAAVASEMATDLKVFWVVATVASAVAVALYLRKVRQRQSGAREL